jgi:tRNA A22 N-methylase
MAHLGNPIKIQTILNAVGNADTLIDIGCNYGFMAKAFLDNRLAKKCFGIDKTIKVVDPMLSEPDRC